MPAVGTDSQPAFAQHMRERHCAGCLSVEGGTCQPAARARCAALVLIYSRTAEGHRTGGSPLYFGARPWCYIPAADTDAQPAFALHTRECYLPRSCFGQGPVLDNFFKFFTNFARLAVIFNRIGWYL